MNKRFKSFVTLFMAMIMVFVSVPVAAVADDAISHQADSLSSFIFRGYDSDEFPFKFEILEYENDAVTLKLTQTNSSLNFEGINISLDNENIPPSDRKVHIDGNIFSVLLNTDYLFSAYYIVSDGVIEHSGIINVAVEGNTIAVNFAMHERLYYIYAADIIQSRANNVTITFRANGGSGNPPAPIIGVAGSRINLPGMNTLSRANHSFIGWGLNSAGTGTIHLRSAQYTLPTASRNLYAIWQVQPTIQLPANNATVPIGDVIVSWNAVTGATHRISLRNVTTDTLVFSNAQTRANNNHTITNPLVPGHRYRVAIGAQIGTRPAESWSEREFTVAGRQTTNAPAQRVVSGTPTATSFTVNAANAPSGWTTQYRIRLNTSSVWGSWQNSNTFSGLTPATNYRAQARFTAINTNTHDHSAASTESAVITTASAAPLFTPVTSITGLPTTATAGTGRTLSGTVNPSNATNRNITWSVVNARTTGATISGSTLNTTAAGTVTLRATIVNGRAVGTNFMHDFNVVVSAATSPPVITAHPSSRTISEGESTTFSVTIAPGANPAPTFQWQVSTNNGVSWSYIGANSSSLTISNVALNANGNRYRVRVSGSVRVYSNPATLTVTASTAPRPHSIRFDRAEYIVSVHNPWYGVVENQNRVIAEVRDQFNNPMPNFNPTFSIDQPNRGVSINRSTGMISNFEGVNPGTLAIRAEFGSVHGQLSATVPLTLAVYTPGESRIFGQTGTLPPITFKFEYPENDALPVPDRVRNTWREGARLWNDAHRDISFRESNLSNNRLYAINDPDNDINGLVVLSNYYILRMARFYAILRFDAWINMARGSDQAISSTAAHELGHVLGLGHIHHTTRTLMHSPYRQRFEAGIYGPTIHDINGVRAIWNLQ